MQVTFSPSKNLELLFEEWKIVSTFDLVGTLIFILAFTLLSEMLNSYTNYLKTSVKQRMDLLRHRTNGRKDSTGNILCVHILSTFTFVLDQTTASLLMLLVMTCSTWIFLTVIFGAGLGFFLCDPLLKHYTQRNQAILTRQTHSGI